MNTIKSEMITYLDSLIPVHRWDLDTVLMFGWDFCNNTGEDIDPGTVRKWVEDYIK